MVQLFQILDKQQVSDRQRAVLSIQCCCICSLTKYYFCLHLSLGLRELNFGYNSFESEIPTEMFLLSDLTYLNLESNLGISGRVPTEFGLHTDLRFLSISDTNLRARIPTEYSSLTDLDVLRMANTLVGGNIPTTFASLSRLAYLDLSGSQFRQGLPTVVGNLTELGKWLLPQTAELQRCASPADSHMFAFIQST